MNFIYNKLTFIYKKINELVFFVLTAWRDVAKDRNNFGHDAHAVGTITVGEIPQRAPNFHAVVFEARLDKQQNSSRWLSFNDGDHVIKEGKRVVLCISPEKCPAFDRVCKSTIRRPG